jgi:hypothetical protein
MDWLRDNWVLIVFVIAMAAMHLFGHGAHGHARRGSRELDEPKTPAENAKRKSTMGNETEPHSGGHH